MTDPMKSWDVFISHATEDNPFVRPLAVALQNLGVLVWYDEFALRLGESLSRSIDKGLASSRFGLVVISPHFIQKRWPEYELRGLLTREIDEDRVIIPLWHGVTRGQVIAFSPPLADKVALSTEGVPASDVAIRILREVRPDLYAQRPRGDLERLASGEAPRDAGNDLQEYKREILTGPGRSSLLTSCESLRYDLAMFREMLGNFQVSMERYRQSYLSASSRDDEMVPSDPSNPTRPRWIESDYFLQSTRQDASELLQRLKVDASRLQASIERVRTAWQEADPSLSITRLQLEDPLESSYYIAKTVAEASEINDWWVREKLSRWVTTLPSKEAALEAAITLLHSWGRFDPKDEDPAARPM